MGLVHVLMFWLTVPIVVVVQRLCIQITGSLLASGELGCRRNVDVYWFPLALMGKRQGRRLTVTVPAGLGLYCWRTRFGHHLVGYMVSSVLLQGW